MEFLDTMNIEHPVIPHGLVYQNRIIYNIYYYILLFPLQYKHMIFDCHIQVVQDYSGILLPPSTTCKKKYVSMQHNYVISHIDIIMLHINVILT